MHVRRVATRVCTCFVMLALEARAQAPTETESPEPAPAARIWSLGIEVGAPRMSSGEFRVEGAVDAALAIDAFGGSLFASGGYYDFESENALADWTRAEGRLEGFWRSGTETSPTRIEVRAAAGAAYYDTTYTGTTTAFTDETSTMYRGSALAGIWSHPASDHFIAALVGGGFQVEDRTELKVPGSSSGAVSLDDSARTTWQASGRLDYRWEFVPATLSLRAHADGTYFAIRRSDDSISILQGSVTSTGTVSEYRQLETHGRLGVEIDALRFVEIAPGVFGGVDAYFLSGPAGSINTVIPLAGVSLTTAPW